MIFIIFIYHNEAPFKQFLVRKYFTMKRFQPSTISSFIKLSLILPPKMPKRCYIPVSSCPNKCQMVYLVGVLDIRMVNWVSINQQTLHNLKNCFKNYLDKLESCSLSLAKIVPRLEKSICTNAAGRAGDKCQLGRRSIIQTTRGPPLPATKENIIFRYMYVQQSEEREGFYSIFQIMV